jgi:hypothetical protein
MRPDTKQRKHSLDRLETNFGRAAPTRRPDPGGHTGKPALEEAVMLKMGRMVAESVLLIEREALAGPDYHPTDPVLHKWAHEAGSIYLGDQTIPVMRPRLRHVARGEISLQSYSAFEEPRALL